jgi:hypothetical protein
MTVKLAAEWFGVSPSTVRGWVLRYELKPLGRMGNAKLYSFVELCLVEARARSSPHLTRARFGGQTSP